MAVYVDDFRCKARVGRLSARWSHLTADTPAELHEFAARLGLRRALFQARCKGGCDPCPHWHYDVTDLGRGLALRLGAESVTWRQLGEIVSARRHHVRPGVRPRLGSTEPFPARLTVALAVAVLLALAGCDLSVRSGDEEVSVDCDWDVPAPHAMQISTFPHRSDEGEEPL